MNAGLSHRHRKWFGWFRLLAAFGSVQVVIQIAGFFSGILIVRTLTKADYAWFTIANTFVSILSMLADSGVSAALSSIGGTIWQDNARMGSLIRTALSLRRRLFVATLIVVTPIFVWLLAKNHAPTATIAVLIALAVAGFASQLTGGVLGVVISLRQELPRMQSLACGVALLRLGLICVACAIFIDVRVAVLVGVAGFTMNAWFLRRWVKASVEWDAPQSPEYRSRILSVVKKQVPLTIFYCIQGQILVGIISIFGSNERVAEIGALNRFVMIFAAISAVVNGVVVPRFARCQEPGLLRRRYWQIVTGFVLLAAVLVVLTAIFPRPLLWVLGSKYASLEAEVWLTMLNAGLGSLYATQYALTFSKAWIASAWISIPMEIVTQVCLILLLDISTVRGVFWLSCISFIPLIILNMIIANRELKKSAAPGNETSAPT